MPNTDNNPPRSYTCANCGGGIRYDIAKGQLVCSSCGTPAPFKLNEVPPTEHPYGQQAVAASHNAPAAETQEISCQSCGAEISFGPHQTATVCPMCGSAHIAAAKQAAGLPPDGIIPFKVDQYQAQDAFRQWLRKRWFAPNSLKKSYQEGRLNAVYLPCWTFDANARASFQGRGGRLQTYRMNGKTHTRINWYPVSGTVVESFDDVRICASASAQRELVQQIMPFGTSRGAKPYDVAYLAGAQAERYAINLDEGYRQAQGQMEAALETAARNQILGRGFQQASITRLSPSYTNVTYKQVLLPVWLAAFSHGNKSWHYAINGETGKVSGERPYSAVKIGLLSLLIAVLALLVLWFCYSESSYAAEKDNSYNNVEILSSKTVAEERLATVSKMEAINDGIFWSGPLYCGMAGEPAGCAVLQMEGKRTEKGLQADYPPRPESNLLC